MTRHASFAVACVLAAALPMSLAQAEPPASPALAEAANAPTATTGLASGLRAQVLLARAQFSPGEIDGHAGSNQARAVRAYQAAKGLAVSGELDADTWSALNAQAPAVVVAYTLTEADVGLALTKVPKDMMEKGKLKALGFESLAEALGERFHASPALLEALNPGVDFSRAGARIQVPNVADIAPLPKATRLVVDKSDSTLTVLDAAGAPVGHFPISSGSERDPLPIGEWKVVAVAEQPTFHYNPALFWDADPSHAKATLPPGPNNPVGTRWIDLSKPHYGIHGTPEPAAVGKQQSHGCVRMTNWDVARLAAAVDASVVVVMQE